MARGWESKSVEMQMEDGLLAKTRSKPVPAGNRIEDADLQRKRDVLGLSRKRLLHEIDTAVNERVREMKRRALEHVEAQIASIGIAGPQHTGLR